MLAANDLEFELPIVGDRTPEIVQAAATLKSSLIAYAEHPFTRLLEHSIYNRARRYYGWTGSFPCGALYSVKGIRVALVNTFTEKGSVPPSRIAKLIESAHALQDAHTVLVFLDEKSPEAVRAALDAGACEFLGRGEINNHEALFWRVLNALLLSHAFGMRDNPEPAPPLEPRPLTVRESTRLSPAEIRAADAVIAAAVGALPSAEERRARRQDLLQVVAPGLRDAETGRLNARRIAEATGLSLAALARSSGVTQQALSATPDSPGAQPGLLPVARLSVLLDEMFTPEHKQMWMQTPHPRFGDRSPADAIEAGDAELVALIVESALEGNLG